LVSDSSPKKLGRSYDPYQNIIWMFSDPVMTSDAAAKKTESPFSKLAEQYEPKLPRKLALLLPFKAHIKELRTKRASCDAIRILLAEVNIVVSNDTVHRFCRDVIGQRPSRSRHNGYSTTPQRKPNAPVAEAPPPGKSPLSPLPNHQTDEGKQSGVPWTPRKRGPRIADSMNL
jgi:hypothetical protein